MVEFLSLHPLFCALAYWAFGMFCAAAVNASVMRRGHEPTVATVLLPILLWPLGLVVFVFAFWIILGAYALGARTH